MNSEGEILKTAQVAILMQLKWMGTEDKITINDHKSGPYNY